MDDIPTSEPSPREPARQRVEQAQPVLVDPLRCGEKSVAAILAMTTLAADQAFGEVLVLK